MAISSRTRKVGQVKIQEKHFFLYNFQGILLYGKAYC
jgi:hypothetical protein